MDVRAQVSMVFDLDKCIGCHTCTLPCKNIWTDRRGAEYMWWNNVETKPGTGYPTLWEDQEKYKGGWKRLGDGVRLNMGDQPGEMAAIFFNPYMPSLDDYYQPWTYDYGQLFSAQPQADQPAARPVSAITREPMEVEAGPNWDDDLGGSPIYAANDPNLAALSPGEREQLFQLERLALFYLPRICNHCLNPGCLAACPAGAIYKRGEDGIVLVDQARCRAWRMCISGCPYKKVYYNWATGKAEKCILCYPRLETQQAPACFHACVGRVRYLGVLLYDAERIYDAVNVPDERLVAAQRDIILDPFDPQVLAGAEARGVAQGMIEAAQKSPAYRLVKEWELALPLHPEFRTLPMLFYIPPLLPVVGADRDGVYRLSEDSLSSLESARIPLAYMAALLSAGNEAEVRAVYRKLIALRDYRRALSEGKPAEEADQALEGTPLSAEQAAAAYHLLATPTHDERFVVPPLAREVAVEGTEDPQAVRGKVGVGSREPARRGF